MTDALRDLTRRHFFQTAGFGLGSIALSSLFGQEQASLSGIANRYVDLTLAPDDAPKIADGGVIDQDATTSAVDLDQIFNTFDPDSRKDLQAVFKGSELPKDPPEAAAWTLLANVLINLDETVTKE